MTNEIWSLLKSINIQFSAQRLKYMQTLSSFVYCHIFINEKKFKL